MAPPKTKTHSIEKHLILFQFIPKGQNFSRWTYRITLPGQKMIERCIADHFEYSERHHQITNQFYEVGSEPSEELKEFARRILKRYREELGKYGRIIAKYPTFESIIVRHLPDGLDKELIYKHINAAKASPSFIFDDLTLVTYDSVKRWTEGFGDHEFRIRAALRGALARAFEADEIASIPPILWDGNC